MGVDFIWHLQDVEKKLDHTRDPPKRHIVITSYDLAQKLQGYERHFGMIICDESHALKTRTPPIARSSSEPCWPGTLPRGFSF